MEVEYSNMQRVIYQSRDNPNCGYGMTGQVISSREKLFFMPDDEGVPTFRVSQKELFGFTKAKMRESVVWFIPPKVAVERALKSKYGEDVLD